MLRRSLRSGVRLIAIAAAGLVMLAAPAAGQSDGFDYKLLATQKTSTMQKEMNEAASAGFHFEAVMGGETSFGGKEAVVIMGRARGGETKQKYKYLLLATQKTGTMQKELQAAGDEGFEYKGQTVFETSFGGQEVVCILERDMDAQPERWVYKLLATKKTGTMQKELSQVAEEGFQFVGVTVSDTAFGGKEVVTITRRKAP